MRASLLAVSDESPELHREHAPKDSHRARGVKTPWNLAEALFAAGISGAAGGVLTGLAAVSILITSWHRFDTAHRLGGRRDYPVIAVAAYFENHRYTEDVTQRTLRR